MNILDDSIGPREIPKNRTHFKGRSITSQAVPRKLKCHRGSDDQSITLAIGFEVHRKMLCKFEFSAADKWMALECLRESTAGPQVQLQKAATIVSATKRCKASGSLTGFLVGHGACPACQTEPVTANHREAVEEFETRLQARKAWSKEEAGPSVVKTEGTVLSQPWFVLWNEKCQSEIDCGLERYYA